MGHINVIRDFFEYTQSKLMALRDDAKVGGMEVFIGGGQPIDEGDVALDAGS